jgi:hypothetical protein
MNGAKVLGVHPVAADEPVFLIEIEFLGSDPFDFGQVTQSVADQPESNWQVAYDERELEATGARRFAFFFHNLNIDSPLETPFGPITLPAPSPVPPHLSTITYEEP